MQDVLDSQWVRALGSEPALRAYAWAGIILLLGVVLRCAHAQSTFLKEIPRDELDPDPGYGDGELKTVNGYRNRIARMRAVQSAVLRQVWARVLLLILLGMIAPGVVISFVLIGHEWLLPGFPDPAMNAGGAAPTPPEYAVFLFDQVVRGALADAPEVFRFGLSPVENNPANAVVSLLIVIHRFAAGLAFGGALYILWRTGWGLPRIRRLIRTYEKRIAELERAQG
jgi:hypothetical protein